MQSWVRGAEPMPAAGAFHVDTYIIETGKGAAGVVIGDGRGFRFFAATLISIISKASTSARRSRSAAAHRRRQESAEEGAQGRPCTAAFNLKQQMLRQRTAKQYARDISSRRSSNSAVDR
jgi:hypothetical protein